VSSPASSFGTRQWFDGRPRHRRPEKCCGKKGPVMTRGCTHRSIARIASCAAAGRESVPRFPIFRNNTPTKPRVKGEALAEARRRSGLSIRAVMVCCWAQGGLFTRASPSVTRRAALQAQPFSTCICSRIICASSTVYRMSSSRPSTTVTGSTADCRWKSPLPRAKAVGLKISSKDIPLNLLCLTFGPLLYGASLGTVAAILIFPFVSIIVSHHDGLPIVARSIRAFARVVPLLALMLASTAWSLDLPTISHRLALAGDLAFCR